jgi:hypothetical protein
MMSAFDQLIAEGYVEGRVGSGTFVSPTLPEELLEARLKTQANFADIDESTFSVRAWPGDSQNIRDRSRSSRPAAPVRTRHPCPRSISDVVVVPVGGAALARRVARAPELWSRRRTLCRCVKRLPRILVRHAECNVNRIRS